MRPADLLRKLVDKYVIEPAVCSTCRGGLHTHAKPGQAIESLTPEERELLSNLKSDDQRQDLHPLVTIHPWPKPPRRSKYYSFGNKDSE